MSDLSNQISGFQKKWMDQQQQWMNDWLKTLQGMSGGTPPDTWQQALEVVEQQVASALDTQRQSLMTLAEKAEHIEGIPEPMTQWVHQMEDGIIHWNHLQQQLWQTWFEMLRSAAPAKEQPGDDLVKNWQEFANRAMEIQEQWLSGWNDLNPAASKPAVKKSKKTSKPAKRSAQNKKKP